MPTRERSSSADEVLARLVAGNERFVRGDARFPTVPREVLAELARAQRPYATILGCSDSRVPPELVFDAGFGELFVVRVAGNVVSPEVMGTLQYAGVHLRTPLFLVLGHEHCGAVQAALAARFRDASDRRHIAVLLKSILPGLQGVDADLAPHQQLDAAVEANVRWSMRQLLDTPEVRARRAEGVMKLVGAVFEMTTGRVRLLPDPDGDGAPSRRFKRFDARPDERSTTALSFASPSSVTPLRDGHPRTPVLEPDGRGRAAGLHGCAEGTLTEERTC